MLVSKKDCKNHHSFKEHATLETAKGARADGPEMVRDVPFKTDSTLR
ncbi:hypothetical protein [Bartonella sp. CM120XJJH]